MSRHRRLTVGVAALAALAASIPSGADAAIELKAPGLQPGFSTGVADYAIAPGQCGTGQPIRFEVTARGRTRARIGAGRDFRRRTRVREALLEDGQAIRVIARTGDVRRVYTARCLPDDFPEFSFSRTGRTHSGLFMIDPFGGDATGSNYSIVFSDAGAPVWWRFSDPIAIDSKALPGSRLSYSTYFGGGFGQNEGVRYELRRPDGSLLDTVKVVGAPTDHHDLQQTENGNYLILSYVPRAIPRDASVFNGDAEAHAIDAVVQEITPSGELVWQWDANLHIGLAETGRWWPSLADEPYDIHHINSVEEIDDGSGDLLVSLRQTDAVYRIDRESGEVAWKLGGTTIPQSLEVRGDSFGDANPLGGQHDARWLGDGKISVYDNATGLGRTSRAVRYRIDEQAGEATLLNEVADPLDGRAFCCGSARVLKGGNWLVSWGGSNVVNELTPSGKRVMELSFAPGVFSYRAQPVGGLVSIRRLRAGMDAQVPPLP